MTFPSQNKVAAPIRLVASSVIHLAACCASRGKDETPYQVILVQDGFAALKVVRTVIPHLILLDSLLPNMDGLECVELLRSDAHIEQTLIILMSANLPQRAKERKDLLFLEKPFELDLLILQIKQILEK